MLEQPAPENDYGRTETDDLAVALAEDDRAEDYGMHSDDRRTCHGCQAWASSDHVHPWWQPFKRLDTEPISSRREA